MFSKVSKKRIILPLGRCAVSVIYAKKVPSIAAVIYLHIASNRNHMKSSRSQRILGHGSRFYVTMPAGQPQKRMKPLNRIWHQETEFRKLQGETIGFPKEVD